jgi:hypothetical protein
MGGVLAHCAFPLCSRCTIMNTTITILALNQRHQQEEKNLHTKHGSKKIFALNPYRQRTKSLEYQGVLTKSNVASEHPHPTVGIGLGNLNFI